MDVDVDVDVWICGARREGDVRWDGAEMRDKPHQVRMDRAEESRRG